MRPRLSKYNKVDLLCILCYILPSYSELSKYLYSQYEPLSQTRIAMSNPVVAYSIFQCPLLTN